MALSAVVGCGEVTKNNPDATPPDADPCATGVCECTVATESTDCGAHEYCNVSATGRTCDCVAGYTDGVSGCVWTGALQDPELKTQTGWMTTNGALLNPTAAGGVDVGEASFVASAICGLGAVKQTFDMPTVAKAEPLVLDLSYKNARVSGMSFDQVLMGVSFGDRWTSLPSFNDAMFHSTRVCLGDASYAPAGTVGKGAPVTLALGPYLKAQQCPNTLITNFAIDHAAIVPANAGECGTAPGLGPNSDAEGTGGWTFITSGSSTGGFVPGVGANGTRGVRLFMSLRCDPAPSAIHSLNVLDTANPALDMFVSSAGAGETVNMNIGQGTLSISPPPLGTSGTVHACLPPSLRGLSAAATFVVGNGAGGSCADVVNDQLVIDNVKVVDDPACASSEAVANPGFEGGLSLGAFGGGLLNGGVVGSGVFVRNAAGVAHGGTKYLSIESYGRCSSAGMTLLPTVPAPSGASGPALVFYSNLSTQPEMTTTVRAQGSQTSLTLTKGGGWIKNTVCLDGTYAGRPLPVTINEFGGSGSCDNLNYGTQTALIDDIEVTTDPSCPVP